MNNPINNPIDLTELFTDEQIEKLIEEYVLPFKGATSVEEPIKPRRMIGRYLTYLDDTHDKAVSIMINMLKDQPSINCDCNDFSNNGKCLHTARVINSLQATRKKDQLKKEKEAIIKELEKADKEKKKKSKEDTKIIYLPSSQASSYNKLDTDDIPGPFIINEANNFTFNSLKNLLRKVSKKEFKNKKIKIASKTTDGFNILHQSGSTIHNILYNIDIQDNIIITCDCGTISQNIMCLHALEATYYLYENSNRNPFLPYLKRIHEKNDLLANYGLTVDDKEAEAFVFNTNYRDELVIVEKPEDLVSVKSLDFLNNIIQDSSSLYTPGRFTDYKHEIGLLFQINKDEHNNFPVKIGAYSIEKDEKNNEKLTKINIDLKDNLSKLSVLSPEVFDILMQFSFLIFKEKIAFETSYVSYSYVSTSYAPKLKDSYIEYFFEKLEQNHDFLCRFKPISLLEGQKFSKANLVPFNLDKTMLEPEIVVEYTEKFIFVKTVFRNIEGEIIFDTNDKKGLFYGKLLKSGNRFYLIKNNPLTPFLKNMPTGVLIFPVKFERRVLQEVLLPLSEKFGVQLPDNMEVKVRDYTLTPGIHLKEFQSSTLIIEPIYYYGDYQFDMHSEAQFVTDKADPNYLIKRNKIDERSFLAYIKSWHSHFRNQNFQPYYTLPFDQVMKQNWFISFTRDLIAKGIKITGFNELKRFKYNTNKPTWDMKISSGIDWFDVQIKVTYGDKEVSLKDIRKAVLSRQDFIVLDDGSIGLLPEEWLEKYTQLFRFSKEEKDSIRINKKQFNIVELLFNQIDDEEIIREIEEKKRKLLQIEDIETAPIPATIQATLRPYQETGYQWMQVLDEISWGGCLADDMGLGKTLQTITFLAYIKEKYQNAVNLIVCPTSLIYNWESELKKFAPDLKYYIFYGTERGIDTEELKEFDIVITSYGIVRNDIERLSKISWEYVVLDESQAIKNPDALSTKSVQLLNARNKFILSGTPLQNNTYDIFAQFNFLNPGMLGNKDFFKQEFANPIDKSGDPEAGFMLRNLIKPFMLRRTKSEVLVDLPEKTETILWCQMESRQKQLYDDYKEYYRQSILSKIDNEGLGKSGIYILEGLLRLRQICDDPRLVKDEDHLNHKGVKIRELMREIAENTGNHKMLIFSQFTEMLALIRNEFDQMDMQYCYLDGSTPAEERRRQVDKFQEQQDIKVFLISLKAGGVGLNLTEADYVYLVDPWWNPAVEQQAIDRTHRIGQKNKIFAYKMICKDSVEEKIIKLQEKKLALSKEIVQNDKAFFKSLSKEDIQYLFS